MVRALPEPWERSDLGTLLKMALANHPPKTEKARRRLAKRLREQVARLLEVA
jgi:hypothetical protein